MQTAQLASNPFALMLDPDAIFRAMDCSDRLARLKRQVFHPLDKPLIARVDQSVAEFDHLIDDEADSGDFEA